MSRHPAPGPGAPHSFPHFYPHITLATVGSGGRPPPPPPPLTASDDGGAASLSRNSVDAGSVSDPQAGGVPDSDPDPRVLLALREAMPLGQRAVHVRFARVLAGDHYFRSIYVAIAPSPELAQLRAALALPAQVGGGKPVVVGPDSPPAFPHLSLYYVADEEAHTRARFLQELEREDVVRHSADGLTVTLRCAGGAGEDGGDGKGDGVLESCICTQIWIVDCEGPVEGWKVLDKILLAK